MSKKPKPSTADEEEGQGSPRTESEEPESEAEESLDEPGKYYYDDAYGYEEFDPELEGDDETD